MVVDTEASSSSSHSQSNFRTSDSPPCTLLTNPPLDPPRSTLLTQVAQVTPHLYLAAATALTPDALSHLNLSLVINVTCELPLLPVDGANSLRISVVDSPNTNLLPYFQATNEAIHRSASSGGSVLIHCVAGVSRSAAICLAYLISHANLTLEAAWIYLRRIRPWVKPNHGFMEQLRHWENICQLGTPPSLENLTNWESLANSKAASLSGAEERPGKQRTQNGFTKITSQRKTSSLMPSVPDSSILKACS